MARKTVDQIVNKWSRNAANAADTIRDGVQGVTESPGVAAANAIDRYREGVMRSLEDGKTEQRMRSVDLTDWQQQTVNRGIPNFRSAVTSDRSKDRERQFMEQFMPVANRVSDEVKRMPKGTLQDSINRATFVISELANFRFRRGRS